MSSKEPLKQTSSVTRRVGMGLGVTLLAVAGAGCTGGNKETDRVDKDIVHYKVKEAAEVARTETLMAIDKSTVSKPLGAWMLKTCKDIIALEKADSPRVAVRVRHDKGYPDIFKVRVPVQGGSADVIATRYELPDTPDCQFLTVKSTDSNAAIDLYKNPTSGPFYTDEQVMAMEVEGDYGVVVKNDEHDQGWPTSAAFATGTFDISPEPLTARERGVALDVVNLLQHYSVVK
jgi:hypothetical protein